VERWVGLGVAGLLGLGERCGEIAAAGEGVEDVAGCAVEDAFDEGDRALCARAADQFEGGCGAADRRAVEQRGAVSAGESLEIAAALGDEGLVGCDDVPAAAEGGFDEFAGGLYAANEFDDD